MPNEQDNTLIGIDESLMHKIWTREVGTEHYVKEDWNILSNQIARANRRLHDNRRDLVHLSHCNFGENAGHCKYGEDDTCAALSDGWSWFGRAISNRDDLRPYIAKLADLTEGEARAWVEVLSFRLGFGHASDIERTI